MRGLKVRLHGRGETAGGYCLGTGMPGPMPGSGGYPMEIHRRPEQIIVASEAHSEIRRNYLADSIGTSLCDVVVNRSS